MRGNEISLGCHGRRRKTGKQGPYDLKAAQHAITRMNDARIRSQGIGKLPSGQFAAIPDDPNSIPDMCIPG